MDRMFRGDLRSVSWSKEIYMTMAEELESLHQLYQRGGLSEEEYARAKASVLDPPAKPIVIGDSTFDLRTRQWAMFLHFSLLAGFIVPILGLVTPILIWQLKKTDFPALDVHGKIVMNWLISSILYAVISAVLIVVLIGIPLLIGLGLLCIIFPIIGGIKANNKEVWRYPFSIEFLK
jgi:uncharacterized protein